MSEWQLDARQAPELDTLAWHAVIDRSEHVARVHHGKGVEATGSFVVEGAWDGPFLDGAFHQSENFFGSGVIVEKNAVWLVPSRALVDRIFYAVLGGDIYASNSLPLLFALTGADLDPNWDYRHESYTILKGVCAYDSSFHVLHPDIQQVQQVYYSPVRIQEDSLETVPRYSPRSFASFDDYHRALTEVLDRLHRNFSSTDRRIDISAYTTVSAGYDSAAVTALVKDHDIRMAFTSRRSNSSILPWMSRRAAIDDGTPIARRFGLPVFYLERVPQSVDRDELLFLAPTSADAELVFYNMTKYLEKQPGAAVVFTGFHGDKVWDVATSEEYLTSEIRRGDTSGLNLGEARLRAGFINVAVPFIFAEEIRDLVKVSRSSEMADWRVGGDYDRPIPRRILEEEGVPRAAFGTRKRAVVQSYNYPVNRELRKEFFFWLRERHGWSPLKVYIVEMANKAIFLATTAVERFLAKLRVKASVSTRWFLGSDIEFPYQLHYWALETYVKQYSRTLRFDDPMTG